MVLLTRCAVVHGQSADLVGTYKCQNTARLTSDVDITHTGTHTHTHAHNQTHTFTHTHTDTHLHQHTPTYTYTHITTHIYTHEHTHSCINCIYVRMTEQLVCDAWPDGEKLTS